MSLSPGQFAAKTGASIGFTPAHAKQWMEFWKLDICENDEFHSCFPRLNLPEARRVWAAVEAHCFGGYDYFLRVWPEWGSSGIWSAPYPGSRSAGGMVDYQYLPLPIELVSDSRLGTSNGFVMRALLWLQHHTAWRITGTEMTDFYNFQRSVSVPNCAVLRGSLNGIGRLQLSTNASIAHIPFDLRTE